MTTTVFVTICVGDATGVSCTGWGVAGATEVSSGVPSALAGTGSTIDGRLDRIKMRWSRSASVCVVVASGGYPDKYEKGRVITGLDAAAELPGVKVFHAGTKTSEAGIVNSGGRVLGITALGETMRDARQRAYDTAKLVSFDGAYVRSDIAMRVK